MNRAEFKEWIYSLRQLKGDGNQYEVECQDWIDTEGNKHISHNEVWFSMIYQDGEIKVLNGWHIGAEDFDWSRDEDGNGYVNYYHHGLLNQIASQLGK